MKLLYVVTAMMIAVAMPSALGDCGESIPVNEGNAVQLAITPIGSYDYMWSSNYATPDGSSTGIGALEGIDPAFNPTPEWMEQTISFIAPPAECPSGTTFTITGQLTSNVANVAYGSCVDECSVTIVVSCVPCPSTEVQGPLCENQWATWMAAPATHDDAAADWQLVVPATKPWQATDKFTWTIHETTTGGAVDVVIGPEYTPSHTFVFGNFAQPTNDLPMRCYNVGVLVETADGRDLLQCDAIGSVCLVYDPTRYDNGALPAGIKID